MKKPASPKQPEKSAKRTPEEKTARKSAKNASQAESDLKEGRADKKASQKKSLKSAAKQLQKELNSRMNEVVTRIRKETKAKLKEVVKEATRRLDGDTERMFEQALHTIVRHYDSVAGSDAPGNDGNEASAPAKASGSRSKSQTLNKDGKPRKPRTESATPASSAATEEAAPKTGARRGPKPRAQAATPPAKRGPKPKVAATAPVGARRGPKPRTSAPAASEPGGGLLSSADSASTGEVSA